MKSNDEKPFKSLPVHSLDFQPLPTCDKCNLPVPHMNSVTEYTVYFNGWFMPKAGTGRHLLRVIIDGKIVCAGSPSRAQNIYCQPRDSRGYERTMSKYGVHEGRNAFYRARFVDAEKSGMLILPDGTDESCPACGGPAQFYYWGAWARNWIIQMHCPACDPEDSVRPILAIPRDRSSDQGTRILDPLSIGLLGLGALRMPFDRAKHIGYEPPPDDLPE